MLELTSMGIGLLMFAFYVCIINILLNKNKDIYKRLDSISGSSVKNQENELGQPLFTRLVKPIIEDISKIVLKITPKELIRNFERKILLAGYPYGMGVKDLLNIQACVMIFMPVITTGLCLIFKVEIVKIVFLIIVEMMIGYIIPSFILGRKISQRQKKILNSLPDMLDLLTVSVEAGLGFDAALAKVIEKYPGDLAGEFLRTLQEIKMGKSRKEALKSLAERVSVPDLTVFISSLIQADQFGISIGNVLRVQSEQMRQKRRQRAQEKAMKAPVKMLIPMVLFIFPTIFSVLIGPVAIRIVKTFFSK